MELKNVLFKVHIPIEAGIGNTLKGFISGLSIHPTTKIQCNPYSVLGNFDTVLEDIHIYNPITDSRTYNVEPFSSCRWLILKEEEEVQEDLPYEFSNYTQVDLNNPQYYPLFSKKVTIDHHYRRDKIHDTVFQRFTNTIKKIQFKEVIRQEVEKYEFDYENTLGISVRTWKASHEHNILRTYHSDVYKEQIVKVLTQNPNLHTIFISLDNDSVKKDYEAMFESFPEKKVIFYDEVSNTSMNHLQHIIVKMLVLSKTRYFICNRISTFSELVFWFGDCKQQVFPLF
jgi:hypothetical protein